MNEYPYDSKETTLKLEIKANVVANIGNKCLRILSRKFTCW